jgi:hypothetical protein
VCCAELWERAEPVVRYRTGDERKASEEVVIASGARVLASLVAVGKTNWGQSECCEYISEVAFDESIRFGEADPWALEFAEFVVQYRHGGNAYSLNAQAYSCSTIS